MGKNELLDGTTYTFGPPVDSSNPVVYTIEIVVKYPDGSEDRIISRIIVNRPSDTSTTPTPDWLIYEPVETSVFSTHTAYIQGYSDGTVRPEGDITRAEAATLIARLEGLSLSDSSSTIFSNTPLDWYNPYINAVVKAGIMKGYPDRTFRPDEAITRAEFAQMIMNLDPTSTETAPLSDVEGHWAELAIDQAYGNKRILLYKI